MGREEEAVAALEKCFEEIRKRDLHKQHDTSKYDVTTMCLDAISEEVEALKSKVEAFQGKHFNSQYRMLEGEFSKLLSDLDNLKLAGREEIRKSRKDLIIAIEKQADALADKVHSDGRSCPECQM